VLSISWHRLDQLEYGLDMDMVSASINPVVVTEPGLHQLGPGHRFVTYPRTIQTLSIVCRASTCVEPYDRLQTRTSDGLSVSLNVSFQYRYDPARLVSLYNAYPEGDLHMIFENTATALLSQVATNYSAYRFFNELNVIATAMQTALTNVIDTKLFAFVDALQITEVHLPAAFQNAIVTSLQSQQNITAMRRHRDNMLVSFESQVLVANQSRYRTIALAQGSANRRRQEADANVAITTQSVLSEMYSYGNLSQIVGLDEAGGLSYIWWDTQTQASNMGKEFLAGLNPNTYIRQTVGS